MTAALVLHALALALTIGLGWRALRSRPTPARSWFLPFVALVAWWALTVAAGSATSAWVTHDSPWPLRWLRLATIGSALAPVAWYAFVEAFVGRGGPRRLRAALLALLPLATIGLALLEPRIGWLLTPGTAGDWAWGPWFWFVHVPYGYAAIVAGAVVVVRAMRSGSTTVRRQLRWLLAAAVVPLLGTVIDLTGWRLLPDLELTLVGFAVGAAALTYAITARRFLHLPPTSYRTRFADLSMPVLFLDAERRVIDRNEAAARLWPSADDGAPPLGRLLPSVAAALQGLDDVPERLEVHAPTLPGRRAALTLTPLRQGRRPPYGYVLRVEALGEPSAASRTTASTASP